MGRKAVIGQKTCYDLTFVLRSDVSDDKTKSVKEKVESIIKQFDGSVIEWQDLGRKKFAYPIQKEVRGQYFTCIFLGTGGLIAELERVFRIDEAIIRFLSVKIGEPYTEEKYRNLVEERKKAYRRDDEEKRPMQDDKRLMAGKGMRKKECRLSRHNIKGADLDYKDAKLLQSFMTEHGRIVPQRVSGNTVSAQKKLTQAIKRARQMALLGYTFEGPVQGGFREPREYRDRDRDY